MGLDEVFMYEQYYYWSNGVRYVMGGEPEEKQSLLSILKK